MNIVILYNLATELKKGTASDLDCEQEITIIVPLVESILRDAGHDVTTLEADMNLWNTLRSQVDNVDLVFNLAEGFGGKNADETLVPAMLEALDIPFTGASSQNMHFTLDKEKTNVYLSSFEIPIAKHQVFSDSDDSLSSDLKFPLIVKPIREEASIGLYLNGVVATEVDLRTRVRNILENYSQPALVEEYIIGREISVGVIGNGDHVRTFEPLEFLFENAETDLHRFRSYEYKWGGGKEEMVKAQGLSNELRQKLLEFTRLAYKMCECRDYARVDFRVMGETPVLLEVNYNPGVGPNSHGLNNTLTKMASFEGLSFENLILEIVSSAAIRYK